MTAPEQQELKVVLRWVKGIGVAVVAGAFALGLWVAKLQGEVDKVPELERGYNALQQVTADLVLLKCAESELNPTEQLICRKYEPRLPR